MAFDLIQAALLLPVIGGSIYGALSVHTAAKFFKAESTPESYLPPITVLKPIYGLDKGLEQNLLSLCRQDYPDYQIVLSVQRTDEPALPLLRRLAAEFPDRVTLVIKPSEPVVNGKVQNLVNALTAARHDVLIISDSDVRLAPDYLRTMAAPLRDSDVGYVCSLYRAIAADRWFEKLELLTFNTDFVPSLVFSHVNQIAPFCIGASVAFRKSDLERTGGMAALGEYLVEDYELGRRLIALGKRMALLPHTVDILADYPTFTRWWNHQLYWDQNTRAANPVGFALTIFTRAIPFALLFATLRNFDSFGMDVLALALVIRLGTAAWISSAYLNDREGLRALWLLPLRDILALMSWCTAFLRRSFEWRGHRFGLTKDGRIVAREAAMPLTDTDLSSNPAAKSL